MEKKMCERCEVCDCPTGRAGEGDDSIYAIDPQSVEYIKGKFGQWYKTDQFMPLPQQGDCDEEVFVIGRISSGTTRPDGVLDQFVREVRLYYFADNASPPEWSIGDDITFAITDVTHWMPLPEPPTEERGKDETN